MQYELWHVPSGNLVGTFPTEEEALALVRAELDAHGRPRAEAFALGTEDRRGRSRLIADGATLVARATEPRVRLAALLHRETRRERRRDLIEPPLVNTAPRHRGK